MGYLTTIGSGGGKARRGVGGPAHLVEIGDNHILLDCGEGAAGQLQHLNKIVEISHVIFSHLHPDHISGLFCLLQNSIGDKRTAPLEIFLPEEGIQPLWQFLDAIYLYREKLRMDWFQLILTPIHTGVLIENKDISIKAWNSDHFSQDMDKKKNPRPAYGITVDSETNRLIYTGDVSSVSCIEDQLQRNSSLLSEGFHVQWMDIVATARKHNLKKTILTHLHSSEVKEIEEFCLHNSDTFIAVDGKQFEW
ncbi:MAG: ribonuclease Z [Calditrichaeota bacterium]|nr:ribonuclease Z [Calditrichota bacterium]MBT7790436.1 ribonuclease Z [Calditrichota bacterium]